MGTTHNLKDIRASKTQYANLKEELINIHSKQDAVENSVANISTEFETRIGDAEATIDVMSIEINTLRHDLDNVDLNTMTVVEVEEARDGHDSLNDRLNAMESLSIFRENLKLTTDRTYTYTDSGLVEKEIITGDINYEIHYNYNDDGDIVSEEHYQNGELVGTKIYEYHPQLGVITKVISDKADHVQLVYNDATTNDLKQRVESIEAMDLATQLDGIRSAILIGPYDGKKLTDLVNSFEARLQSVEQFANGQVSDVIDVPDIVRRLENLEYALASGRKTDEFIVESSNIFVLSSPVTLDHLRVHVDGILVDEGAYDDYVLGEDKRTITFSTKLLQGCKIMCEYY